MLASTQGCLAARWITDLAEGVVASGLFACKPNTSHNLHTVTTQSSNEDGVVVCICDRCKKTLIINIGSTGSYCRPNIERMHHLVRLEEEEAGPADKGHKYFPVLSRATFICSANACALTVGIQVCGSRLPQEYEAALMDQQAVLDRLQELVASEPQRYEDLQSPERRGKLIPAHYLMQYLNDAISSDPDKPRPLKVSVRNKFFHVCFSDRFDSLFEYLEFQVTEQGGEKFMQLPVLDDEPLLSSQLTPFESRRAWFEILRIHLSFLLDGSMPSSLKAPIDVRIQRSTRETLTLLLNAKYNKSTFAHLGDYSADDFKTLGVERDMHEIFLWYAAICQKQTNPSQRQEIFNALSRVSRGREGSCFELRTFLEEEAIELVTLESAKEAQPTPLSRAYQRLKVTENCDDTTVAAAYYAALQDPAPGERKTARLSLSAIGKARDSRDLVRLACNFESAATAVEFLEIPPDTMPEFVGSLLLTYENEARLDFDKVLVAAAVRELAQEHSGHPQLLEYATHLESESKDAWSVGNLATAAGTGPAGQEVVNFSVPVGLVNIRNTCYLNSILQYFNTVIPVRNVVLNWEDYKLELTEESISNRRLGGSGSTLDKAEAFLAARFVEEMRSLFFQLQNADVSYVRPEQRLALAALNTPDRLVKDHYSEGNAAGTATLFGPQPNPNGNKHPADPPSLPPRPPGKPSTETRTLSTEPTVTVTPVGDNMETGSNVSSVTLVDQKDGDSDYTSVTSIPPAIPAKQRSPLEDDDKERGRSATREHTIQGISDVEMDGTDGNGGKSSVEDTKPIEEVITKALADKSVTGTDQQDVEEVMGNVLEHLHAAIKPTGTDENTGKQTDIITETFYWSSMKYIREVDMKTGVAKTAYRSVNDLSRWMTAFPANGAKVDLYTALDNSFDQEYQEDGNETFTSITKAPPILHVYIQRVQNANGQLTRNNNVVEIPEVLSLDRYMDGDSNSEVLRKRQRSWNLKRRLKSFDGPTALTAPAKPEAKKDDVKETGYEVIDKDVDAYEEALLSINTGEGEDEEEFVSILDPEQEQMLKDHNLLSSEHVENGVDVEMGSDARESLVARLDPETAQREKMRSEGEKAKAEEELSSLFSNMNDVAYRLHAVICQSGNVKGGHYWVWIYDFGANIWRKYNDQVVEAHADTASVLKQLNSNGDPYYLAYVRDTKVGELVTIPERVKPPAVEGRSEPTVPAGDLHDAAGSGSGTGTVNPAHLERAPNVADAADVVIDGIGVDTDMEDAQVMHVEDRGD